MLRALAVALTITCGGCGPPGPGGYCRALEDPCSPRCDRRPSLAAECEPAFAELYGDERANLDACVAECGGLLPPCECSAECGFPSSDETCTRCVDRCSATDSSCSCVARCGTRLGPAVERALAVFYDCVGSRE